MVSGEHLCVNHSPLVHFVIKIITVLCLISWLSSVNCFCLEARYLHLVPPVLLSIPPQGRGAGEQGTEQVGCDLQYFTMNTKLGTAFQNHNNN